MNGECEMGFYIIMFIMWLLLGAYILIDKPYYKTQNYKTQNEWRFQYFLVWILLMIYLLERIIG
jgi:hypothetical protein